jgi:multimeric flavodoxin WrbA
MNILAVNSSPRKRGNAALLTEQIVVGATESGHICNTIYLPKLNIKDCTGCRVCQKKGACVIRDDDIERIEIAVKWADVIILASPTHWGNISAYMLRMFERLFG